MMPTPTLFILFSFLLRIVEGVGTAMYSTVSYTLLTQFYPEKKGTVFVSGYYQNQLHSQVPDGTRAQHGHTAEVTPYVQQTREQRGAESI